MYVRMYVRMYLSMYVCMYARMYVTYMNVFLCVWCVCVYVCVYVCVCGICVCVCVCVCVYCVCTVWQGACSTYLLNISMDDHRYLAVFQHSQAKCCHHLNYIPLYKYVHVLLHTCYHNHILVKTCLPSYKYNIIHLLL